jgi:DeoR/GlpR family transcriptional regulator of sugar metabolism
MTSYLRRQKLLQLIQQEPDLRVPELAMKLCVSEGTIRNDLNSLAMEGQVIRVHGGAFSVSNQQGSSPAFATRARQNSEIKNIIARYASQGIKDGDAILLDASTTIYAMARYLKDRTNLRVFTNGIEVARLLAINPSNTVILLGGVLRQDGTSITGSLSEKFLNDLHFETAYISCSGFSIVAGLTEVDIHEALLKEIAIRSSRQVMALIDSTKFGRTDLTSFARLDQITHLYTDSGLSPFWKEELERAGVNYTICE